MRKAQSCHRAKNSNRDCCGVSVEEKNLTMASGSIIYHMRKCDFEHTQLNNTSYNSYFVCW